MSRKHGNKLRVLRKKIGISQLELANMSNERQGTISDFENGKRNLTLNTLEKIVRPIGMEVEIKFVKKQKEKQ